jgi:hypothetical protein
LRADDAFETAILQVVAPGAIAAAVAAEAEVANRRDQVGEALARDPQRARYAADRAFRQYDAANRANRLVAAELESRWNEALTRVAEVEKKIAAHAVVTTPRSETAPQSFTALANDLKGIWSTPTTDARPKKRIVGTLINEVIADIDTKAAEVVFSSIGWAAPTLNFDCRGGAAASATPPRPTLSMPYDN